MGFIGPGVYNFSERFAKKLVRLGKGKYVEKPNVVKEEKQALETKEEKQAPKVTKKRTKKK